MSNTPEQKLAAIISILTDEPGPFPVDVFWLPTAEAQAELAAEGGLTPAQVAGWSGTGENTAQAKMPALQPMPAFVSGGEAQFPRRADVLRYAGCGYRPDGSHWLWHQNDLAVARDKASRLQVAVDAAAMDEIVPGSGAMDRDAAEFAVMTGLLPGNPIPKIAVGQDGFIGPVAGEKAVTVEDVTLYLSQPVPTPWG